MIIGFMATEKLPQVEGGGLDEETKLASFSEASDEIHDQNLMDRYITGLCPKLAVDKLIEVNHALAKGLVENGLDACRKVPEPKIDVVYRSEADQLQLSCRDNGVGMTREKVVMFCDVSRWISSKALRKLPVIGSKGNDSRCFFASPIVLSQESDKKLAKPSVSVRIESFGHCYDLAYDVGDERARIVKKSTSDITIGTRVTLFLPLYSDTWKNEQEYGDLLEKFARQNPGVNFTLTSPYNTNVPFKYPLVNKRTRLEKVEDFRECTRCFSRSEFIQRTGATIKTHRDEQVEYLTNQFRDLSKKQLPPQLKGKKLGDLEGNTPLIVTLYEWMCKETTSPLGDVLEGYALGKKHLDALGAIKYRIYHGNNTDKIPESGVYIPHIFELALIPKEQKRREIITSINRSPRVKNLFEHIVYTDPPKLEGKEIQYIEPEIKGMYSLEDICEHYGIKKDAKVTIMINITTCAVQYKDDAKTEIDTIPFYYICAFMCDFLKGYKRLSESIKRKNAQTADMKKSPSMKAIIIGLLTKAIKLVSSNGMYRYKQRQLFYALRQLLDEDEHLKGLILNYEYLTGSIIPDVRNGKYKRKEGEPLINLNGLLKEANSKLVLPNGEEISLTTEAVERITADPLKIKFVLFSEKTGEGDQLLDQDFGKRFDCALILSHGQASEATRELVMKFIAVGITVFGIHDADPWGNSISWTLNNGTNMMPSYSGVVIDLGPRVSELVETWHKKPEKINYKDDDARKKWGRIPDYLVQSLPVEDLALYTGLSVPEVIQHKAENWALYADYRIELNALYYEELLAFILEKLKPYNVLNKVRPPPDVLRAKTREYLQNTVESTALDTLKKLVDFNKIIEDLLTGIPDFGDLNMEAPLNTELDKLPLKMWDTILSEMTTREGKDILSRYDASGFIAKRASEYLGHLD